MPRPATRDRIVETADRLFYERGYESTSFSDLAADLGISRGNVTFHFPAKDDILEAVIAHRFARTRAMLDRWEAEGGDAGERIGSFIGILLANRVKILRHGCPVGTLCAELAKLEHAAGDRAAGLFTLFREWLGRQFRLLGCGEKADVLAMHLLARSQGIATLANALQDEAFLREEVRQLRGWLAALAGPSSAPV